MNDFTKDELEDIYRAISLCDRDGYEVGASDMLPKIQSMIDKYCEHAQRQYYEHVPVYECEACKMVTMI